MPAAAKPRSGHPSMSSLSQESRLKSYALKYPFKTAQQPKKEVPGWSHVAVRTIQDRLQKKLGLPSRRAAKKPMLTEPMKRKRLAFARKCKHWTEHDDWRKVMFSDESTFSLVNPQVCHSKEAKDCVLLHHQDSRAVSQCQGVGGASVEKREGRAVLSPKELHHEWGKAQASP